MIESSENIVSQPPQVKQPRFPSDLTGLVFNRLTVIMRHGKTRSGDSVWQCRCICGAVSHAARGDLTKRNGTQSCGCLARELSSIRERTHGLKNTREYRIWHGMKTRCFNKNSKDYHRYGGRGIAVCEKWANSFENFLADIGKCPSPSHQIDRIDNNRGYSPDNCRWATCRENNNNRTTTHFIEVNGRRQSLESWAAELGINSCTIRKRIEAGWPDSRLLEPTHYCGMATTPAVWKAAVLVDRISL